MSYILTDFVKLMHGCGADKPMITIRIRTVNAQTQAKLWDATSDNNWKPLTTGQARLKIEFYKKIIEWALIYPVVHVALK